MESAWLMRTAVMAGMEEEVEVEGEVAMEAEGETVEEDAMDAMLQVLVPKVATENAAGTGGEEEMQETGVMAGALETLVVAETGLLLN
jgi:hypothetical protein